MRIFCKSCKHFFCGGGIIVTTVTSLITLLTDVDFLTAILIQDEHILDILQ